VILATPKKRRQRRVSGSAAGLAHFAGPVSTLQCFEDNSLVKAALDEPGAGRVLVVDGGASLRRALLGGNLAAAAQRNGWAGVVINGCVRDVAELRAAAIGIRALAAMPLPTKKRQLGLRELPVQIQGVPVRPGDWLYADADGMVLSALPLHAGSASPGPDQHQRDQQQQRGKRRPGARADRSGVRHRSTVGQQGRQQRQGAGGAE